MATLLSRFRIQCEKMTILSDIGKSPTEERSAVLVCNIMYYVHYWYYLVQSSDLFKAVL